MEPSAILTISKPSVVTASRITCVFGSAESLLAHDMYQFDDYSKYVATRFDAAAKAKHREEQFPVDCRKAFELGERLARQAGAQSR